MFLFRDAFCKWSTLRVRVWLTSCGTSLIWSGPVLHLVCAINLLRFLLVAVDPMVLGVLSTQFSLTLPMVVVHGLLLGCGLIQEGRGRGRSCLFSGELVGECDPGVDLKRSLLVGHALHL